MAKTPSAEFLKSANSLIIVASFYMDGPTLSWYQWMTRNGFISSWPALLQALESKFAPTFFEDPQGALFELQQRSSVNDYLTEFERLANRIIGLSSPSLLSCFISGLYPELRREVQALQPMSLPQAVALAKLQEEKLQDRRWPPRAQPFTQSQVSRPATSSSLVPSTVRPQIKRLTVGELVVRRDKGLCYHCDKKWIVGHRCRPRLHLLIADEEDD